jgi:hypothetical protein
VVLRDWQIGPPAERTDGQAVYPVQSCGIAFDAVASPGTEGKALRKALDGLRKKKLRPPLFALMHYDKCRLVVQPLAVFEETGPTQLMLSDAKIDRAAVLKALKF